MTSGSDEPPDEGTVIIPMGQSGRAGQPAALAPTIGSPPAAEAGTTGDDHTTVILPGPVGAAPAAEETTTAVDAARASSGPSGPVDLTAGTVLGNYRVGKMIARGGLGAIYDGVNIHNPAERVAIKTILPEPGLGERFAKMLLDESNALMRVRHDAVVPYRTYGRIGDSEEFYLVLEFVDGDVLNDFYRRRRLNERELFALARRLAAGLQASHEEGLIHRDVSPDNVLLQNNQLEKATLIDFGIAKLGDIEELPDAQFAGKLSYAAPEQFVRGARIGPWTDCYSLALLLVAAARGQPLPMGKTLEEAQEARCEIPELKGVPAALVAPLRKMLEPHPPDRPQSMIEVIALLDEAERNAASAKAATPQGQKAGIRRIDKPPRARAAGGGVGRSLLSAALALLLGGGVVAGVMVFGGDLFGNGTTDQPPNPPPPPPPPQTSRAEQLAKIAGEFRTRLAAAPCTLTRVDASDSGTAFSVAVSGVWADDAAVKKLAADAAAATGASATAGGEILDRSLCSLAEQLKPAGELGPGVLAWPKPTGNEDRSVVFDMALDDKAKFVVLFEADAAGRLSQLLDVSPNRRQQLIADQRISDRGNGRYRITLVPHGAEDNVSETLLIAAMSPSEPPGPGMPLKDWATSLAAAKGVIDVVPREGVAPSKPPPPPPPNQTRPEAMAAARQAVLTRLNAVSCAAVRLSATDDGQNFTIRVGGIWGDYQAMQSAAGEAATATSTRIEVDGRVVDNALCPSIDAFKKITAELGPPMLGAPQPSPDGDRASFVSLTPPPDKPALYLFEVDRAGKVLGLMDLGTPEARSKAVQAGLAEDLGEGRVSAKLVPPGPTANVDSTLLVLLAGTAPPSGFVLPAETDMAALLQAAGQFGATGLGLDLIERTGVAAPAGPPPSNDPFESVRQSFREISCSMIRLEATDGAASVFGLWGDEKPVKIAADLAAEKTKMAFTLAGDHVSGDLCQFIDKLKPFFSDQAPVSILDPKPTGQPDRSVSVQVIADPTYPYLYFYAIDPDGRVDSIIELSNEGKLAAAVNAGLIEAPGNGRFRITLPPYSQDNDTRSSVLMTVMSKQRLESALFEFRGAIAFGGWLNGLTDFAKGTPVRIDIVEYVQVPP